MNDALGFAGAAYNQIIVFREKAAFLEALVANPHIEGIVGADDETQLSFPGVYIAGIKSRQHRDNMQGNL